MSVLSKIVSNTIGVVSPKYRTLSQWAVIYNNIIQTKTISAKTKDNRKNYLSKILVVFGGTAISKIRSCDISIFISEIQKTHPQLARRVLVELQCLFEQSSQNSEMRCFCSYLLKDIESQYYNEQDKPWSIKEINEFCMENS